MRVYFVSDCWQKSRHRSSDRCRLFVSCGNAEGQRERRLSGHGGKTNDFNKEIFFNSAGGINEESGTESARID